MVFNIHGKSQGIMSDELKSLEKIKKRLLTKMGI